MKVSLLASAALLVATAATVAILPANAAADSPPSVWDRARDPNVALTYNLHVETQEALRNAFQHLRPNVFAGELRPDVDLAHEELRRALDRLLRNGAETSRDVRLRFDLGELYFEIARFEVDSRKAYTRSAEVLRAALADFPDHPMADAAWLEVAFACGHIGEHDCERDAYKMVLLRRTDEAFRAVPTLNLAETEMHLGRLDEAIEGYREAMRLAARYGGDGSTAAMAAWGLAVALDRSGDHTGAEREARFAIELEHSLGLTVPLLHTDNVFFVPDYEIHWYDGLGAAALARAARPADAVRLWSAAERSFTSYVAAAESAKEKDRWVEIAKARLAAVKAARIASEKKAPKERPPATPFDEEPTESNL